MFRKIINIDDVYSCLKINEECITYYSSDFKLKLLDSDLVTVRFEQKFSRDFDYKIYSNCMYLSFDNELQILNMASFEFKKACHADKQHVTALSNNRYLASSYRRKEKQYDNSIFDDNCKLLWGTSGEMSYRDIYETHLLLSDKHGKKIGYLNFVDCKVNWQRELSQSINGESIEAVDLIIIPLLDRLVALKSDSGEKLWDMEFPFSHYNYDKISRKLYGLGGNKFEAIDCATGNREIEQELSLNANISSHLTCYSEGSLYFTALIDNNTPVFGAVNVQTGELELTQEVEIAGEKSFIKGLDKPVVVGNRLYVKDSMNTLHIFEKNNN